MPSLAHSSTAPASPSPRGSFERPEAPRLARAAHSAAHRAAHSADHSAAHSAGHTVDDGRQGGTPYLRLDPNVVTRRFHEMTAALPGTAVHYAVKANPHPDVLRALVRLGAGFDVAGAGEVVACLEAGATAEQLLYTNPVKVRTDLQAAYDLGVRGYVVDCMTEMLKVADEAPGSSLLCRLVTSRPGATGPRSRKYGCSPDACVEILSAAHNLGLDAAGISFHVGSQQRDPNRWRPPIVAAGAIFHRLRARRVHPWMLGLGGGFPARYAGANPDGPDHPDHPDLAVYGDTLRAQLLETFGGHQPHTLIGPGRGLVADAGVLNTTVVAVCWRGGRRWVYVDAGVSTGLVETLDEAVRYRITTDHDGMPDGPAVLAGPTCTSTDVLYEKDPVQLPLALKEGDRVRLHSAGAYVSSNSTVGFNGFHPLPTNLAGPAA